MATSYDGSINIDARMNIKNAVINSKNLGKAIESLKSIVDTFGKDAAQSTNAFVNVLTKASTVLSDASSAFSGIENGAQQMIGSLSDTSLINKSWQELKSEMIDLQMQLGKMKDAGLTENEVISSATDSVKQDIATLMQQSELLSSAEYDIPYPFEEFEQSISPIEEFEQSLAPIIDQIKETSVVYRGLSGESQSAGQTMSNSMADASQSVQGLQNGLEDVENAESRVQTGTQEIAQSAAQSEQVTSNAMNETSESANNASVSLSRAANSATRFASKIASGALKTAVNTIKSIGSAAVRAAANLAKMVGGNVLSFLRKLADGAKNAAVQLAKMVTSAVANGVKKLGSLAGKATKSLLGMNKASRGDGFKEGLKFLVRYVFGVRSLFMLYRKLRGAVVEAFENMAQKVPEVNKTISKLVSSLDLMKNSLATAFQPILTAVTPYLVQLMDMMSEAAAKVGEFFAVLTGQNYIYKATKANIDYAKSLDKSTKSTKKNTKETENQLASFDHLNILKENKDTGSSSDSDKDETPTSDFKKVPIESAISDLAKRIKDAFNKGDFTEIGKILANKLTEWVNEVDWDGLGKKIAAWINNIVNLINGFFDNFDWVDLGHKLAEGFMKIIDEVDPYELGRFLTQKFAAIIKTLWGFIDGIEWDKVGVFIGTALQGAFDNIPWETLFDLIAQYIMGIFTAIYYAASTFEWGKAGIRIANALRHMIESIDINVIYKALSTLLKGILDFIIPILTDTATWAKIGSDFATFLNNFFKDEELWKKVRLALIGGITSALVALKLFVAKFEWGANGQRFGEQLRKLVDDFPDDLGETLSNLLTGALEFMNGVFQDEGLFISIGHKFGTWLFAIFENDELWANLGEFIGLLLTDVIAVFQTFFDDFDPVEAANSIKTGLDKLGAYLPGIATGFWNMVKTAFSKAGSFVDAMFSESASLDPEVIKSRNGDSFYGKIFEDERNAVSAFNAQSLGAKIGTKLAEAVNDAINNYIPWSDIGVIFNDLLNTGLDFANNFVKNFDTDGFLNGITSAMEEIEWDKVLEKILELMINAVDMVGDLTQKLIYRLFGFDDEETTKLISENMERTLEAAMPGSVTPEVKAKMRGYADESADTLADEFIQRMSSGEIVDKDPLLPWFRDADAKASQEALVSKMQEVYQYAADNNIGGEQISESLFTGFIQSVTDNTTGQVKDKYKSLIENMFGSVDAINNGSLTMEQFFAGLNSGIDDFGGETKKQFLSAIDGMLTEVKESPEGFDEHSPSKRAKSMSADFVAGLTEGIEENKDGFVSSMETALDGVVNTVDSKWGDASNAQSTKLNEMSNVLSNTMGDMTDTSTEETENQAKPVYDNYGEIMVAVDECMRAARDYLIQYTDEMTRHMNDGMYTMRNDAQRAMSDLSYAIRDAMYDINSIDWSSVGDNIINGIANGIYGGWNWLNDTVWNLANSLFQSAKNALGIASPSKVFRDQVGHMVGAGLAEGLDDSQHEVLGSITDMAKAMVDEMQTTDLTADVGVNDNTMLDSITGALSTFSIKIEDSFITLTERLQAIADKVTFITPDIATGTVLPYAVSGGQTGGSKAISDVVAKTNDEQTSALIQAFNNQTIAIVRAIEQYSTTNVNIDKKSLTDAIIEEINRRTRAQGSSPLLI